MPRGKHEFRPSRGIRALVVVLAVGIPLAVVAAGLSIPTRASASGTTTTGKSQTVKTTINIPAMVVDNLCNADVVNLSGDATITVTTTPRSNGGYTVRSSFIAPNLRGTRILPPPPIGYKGDDRENAYSYYAPAGSSTHRVVHWTKLVPQGNAPTMYLVVVIREAILADGTPAVPVFERAYLICRQPTCSSQRV
jgi:hypothetical protein